jgi:hypothetical protein
MDYPNRWCLKLYAPPIERRIPLLWSRTFLLIERQVRPRVPEKGVMTRALQRLELSPKPLAEVFLMDCLR